MRRAEQEDKLAQLLRQRIGEEAYEKTTAFRDWLETQADPAPILALLSANK
ncbi:hypothetical protein [Roseibacillus persicicus]|uniref:Uncharacterized protein n=1 Tax=Roseibacillus persicicus TaxID=454148 RepID=A0A918TTF9_9BACT|nr:hypothetical protein [Roseibacillus persicicus]GHC62636.1 hypothetical protein GCM10007100_32630 [Roseibacillus persicicus]